jgi:hypothetical protein
MSPSETHSTKRGLRIAGVVGAVVAIAIVATGVLARSRGDTKLREWTEAQAIPTVAVAAPTANGDGDEL